MHCKNDYLEESKFIDIKGVLETMSGDVKAIKEDLGLNGKH